LGVDVHALPAATSLESFASPSKSINGDKMSKAMEPNTIHNCTVVRRDELEEPMLVDHDGKMHPVLPKWQRKKGCVSEINHTQGLWTAVESSEPGKFDIFSTESDKKICTVDDVKNVGLIVCSSNLFRAVSIVHDDWSRDNLYANPVGAAMLLRVIEHANNLDTRVGGLPNILESEKENEQSNSDA